MDFKVYTKEEVEQPSGTETIISPNIIDIYPVITEKNGTEILSNAEILTDEKDILEQAVALATIWQKGQDPLDLEQGVRWSEALLSEINVLQLMEDITNAVSAVTPSVMVVFDTVEDENGNSYLKYTLKASA